MNKADLEKRFKKYHSYRFYNHADIEKRGFATILDEICTVWCEQDGTYQVTVEYPDDEVYDFNSLDEMLSFVTRNGKTVEQVLKDEDEFVSYHVRQVILDENGNILDQIIENSIAAISMIGVKRDKKLFKIWCNGTTAMIERIHPSLIIAYGGELEYDYKKINVVYFENKVTERMKTSENN